MIELHLALQTLLLLVLIGIIAYLCHAVTMLKRELRDLMRQGSAPTGPQAPTRNDTPVRQGPPQPLVPAHDPAPVAVPHVPTRATTATRTAPPTTASPLPPANALPVSHRANAAPSPSREPSTPQASPSLEGILGGRVLAILAALMVFAGLIFLALLVAPALSDAARCTAMFALSGAITVAGVWCMRRKSTPFSQALLGCGLGSVFISLLVAHAYFGLLPNIAALVLLLLWLCAALRLSWQYRSAPLYVLAQIGMALSVCLAYRHGVAPSQLPVVALYQLMCAAVVVGGGLRAEKAILYDEDFSEEDLLRARRLNRAGTLVALLTSLGAGWILADLPRDASTAGLTSPDVIAGAMQFLITSVLVVYLSDFAGYDEPSNRRYHVAAEALWHVALVTSFSSLAMRAVPHGTPDPTRISLELCVFVAVLHWARNVLLLRIHVVQEWQERVTVGFSAVTTCMLLVGCFVIPTHPTVVPFLAAVMVGLWLTSIADGWLALRRVAVLPLVLEAALVGLDGYDRLATVSPLPLPLLHLACMATMLLAWWRLLPQPDRDRLAGPTLVGGVLGTEVLLVPACSHLAGVPTDLIALLMATMVVAFLSLRDPHPSTNHARRVAVALHANELVVALLACLTIAGGTLPVRSSMRPTATVVLMAVAFLVGVTLLVRALRMASNPQGSSRLLQTGWGVVLTLWATSIVWGLLPVRMAAAASVVAMVCALFCIVLGFVRTLSALRLYGLVATLLCVLKIVMVDVGSADPVARVVLFILGGLICFAVSAVYTFALRRLAS